MPVVLVRSRLVVALTAALAPFALAACDSPTDATRIDGGSFRALQSQVLTPTCATAGCHTTASHAGGLVLEAGASHAALIGVKPANSAARAEGLRQVVPGDPERSFLLHKVEMALEGAHSHGTANHGGPMPLTGGALTSGQVAFIRAWIAAGAPRDGLVADSALLRPADEVTVPFEPLAPPAEGLQLHLKPFTTAARGEREVFVYGTLPTTDTLFVRRFDVRMRPGSHHFLLYAQNATGLTPGAVRDLGGASFLEEMQNFTTRTFLIGTQTPEATVELPQGIVLPLPPRQGVDLNAHYANPTAAPRTGEAYVNLHTTPRRAGLRYARVINDAVTDFVLPARQRTVVERTTRFSQPRSILMLMTHAHKLSESFRVYGVGGALDGQLIYESLSWDHPPIKIFQTPIAFAAGTGYRMVATYNNTTDRTVRFGFTSEDEMCILFGYYVR